MTLGNGTSTAIYKRLLLKEKSTSNAQTAEDISEDISWTSQGYSCNYRKCIQ